MEAIDHTASHIVKIVADREPRREKRVCMHKIFVAASLGMALSAGAALAGNSAAAPAAKPPTEPVCKRAEINPVTGSVLCIDPLGAPVEAPPAEDAAPCKPGQHKGEAWTWGPTCTETPEG
jgi:hypothetical protein